MKFSEAYIKMRGGAKIALPEWAGYWYWSEEQRTVTMHLASGEEIDIRETTDISYTFAFICREDWSIVNGY